MNEIQIGNQVIMLSPLKYVNFRKNWDRGISWTTLTFVFQDGSEQEFSSPEDATEEELRRVWDNLPTS